MSQTQAAKTELKEAPKAVPVVAKTTQEKMQEMNQKMATLGYEAGIAQYNIIDFKENIEKHTQILDEKNRALKNAIIEMNALSRQAEKEAVEAKSKEAIIPEIVQ